MAFDTSLLEPVEAKTGFDPSLLEPDESDYPAQIESAQKAAASELAKAGRYETGENILRSLDPIGAVKNIFNYTQGVGKQAVDSLLGYGQPGDLKRALSGEPVPTAIRADTVIGGKLTPATPEDFQATYGVGKGTSEVLSGLSEGAASLVDFFRTPEGIAMAGTGKLPVPARAVAASTIATQIANQSPHIIQSFEEAREAGDKKGMAKAGFDALMTVAGTAGMTKVGAPPVGKVPAIPEEALRDHSGTINEMAARELAERQVAEGSPSPVPEVAATPPTKEFIPAIRSANGEITTGVGHVNIKEEGVRGESGFVEASSGKFMTLSEVARIKLMQESIKDIQAKKPISLMGLTVDQAAFLKSQLPEGYALEGNRYVFKPPTEPPKVAETTRPNVLSDEPNVQVKVEGDNIEMRKLSARGTQAPSIPEPVQERIAGAPESFYQQQSVKKVVDVVRGMTDAELGLINETSNIFTAAKLEQVNRLLDSGKNDAGYDIFADLATRLTRLGQVINQAKLLQGLNPQNVVKVVNADLKKAGRDPLTLPQSRELETQSKTRIEKERTLDKATDQWVKEPTDANAKLAEKALNESNTAALNEQKAMHRFQHRTMAGLLKSILQGGMLTPISEVANIVGNISFTPFRMKARAIASTLDAIDATLRSRPREIAVRPGVGTSEMVKGLIRGIKEIPGIVLKGSGNVIKGEARVGLHPLEAWTKMFAKNPDMPTVGGKVPFSDRVKLLIEGTFGVPAEAMLRGLAAGDAPFRQAARARLIAEAAKLNKVPNKQLSMAQKFPELFFDEPTLKRIHSETAKEIFQRESETLQHLTSLLGKKGGWFDLAVAFVAPYKLTPWNIIGEILSYNPLIAAGRTALEAKRGNTRAAELSAGKMVVGGLLTGAGWWLYKNGLLSPSLDSKDEAQKARILSGKVIPPNHVNLTGLERKLKGGDPAFQAGDKTVDIFRGGGLAGSMFYMTANIGRDLERKPADDSSLALSLIQDSVLEQARFGVNQSFLKGIAGVLQSITTGETDNFVQSFANAIISIPIPNTLSTLSRAQREYKVDIRADRLDKEIGNVVKTRLGFTGTDDYLPLKRGLWGEPLPETPKDRNALVYHFFDISKGQQVTDDAVPLELYRLWRKTGDARAIPSLPSKSITVGGDTFALNSEQQSRYAELVGQQRRSIIERIVVNPEWHKRSDEIKIKMLENVYDKGQLLGKALFWQEARAGLEKKPVRTGFQP